MGQMNKRVIFSCVAYLYIYGNLEWLEKEISGCPSNYTILKLYVPGFNVKKILSQFIVAQH